MPKKSIDRTRVKELRDKGATVNQIAEELRCTKGAISKVLKEMGLAVVKASVEHAPKYADRKDAATEHLLFLTEKARRELEWIEREVPPKTDAEYRAWQDQKLKFAVEMRKLIGAIADIGYKLFQANEVAEVLRIIDEEIGCESEECQHRIRERLQRRRDIRFPVGLDRPAYRGY
jgi:DNA-binding MarR family transcriptional regulator